MELKMSPVRPEPGEISTRLQIAQALVEDRRRQTSRDAFPGRVPTCLEEAYEMQLLAAKLWGEAVAGWKVGRILGDEAAAFGEDRFIGPIFRSTVVAAGGAEPAPFPMISGGTACFEAEIVAIVASDTPSDRRDWSPDEAGAYVAGFHLAVEVAGSSVRDLGAMGATASVAAFGNNAGLLLGPALGRMDVAEVAQIPCTSWVDGVPAHRGGASRLPGGPLAAVAFALNKAAELRLPLRAGQLISTGALTGVHPVSAGQRWTADFDRYGVISCTVQSTSS